MARTCHSFYLNPDFMSTPIAIEKFTQTKIYGGFGLWPLPIRTMDPHALDYSALDIADTIEKSAAIEVQPTTIKRKISFAFLTPNDDRRLFQ